MVGLDVEPHKWSRQRIMQILNTKFHIPAPDQGTLVQRKALIKFMSDAHGKGLVRIQAPAGFGQDKNGPIDNLIDSF